MISYATLGTNDMVGAMAFYDHVFAAIEGQREVTSETWVQYGRKTESGKVCMTTPYNGKYATGGNGTMLAFQARDYNSVDAFYTAALAYGGSDEGKPGIREDTHYVAYVRDPDGNKLCVFTPKK